MYYLHVTNTNSYYFVHQVLAENFDFVSIFFADIVDFSALTANCTPNEVNSVLSVCEIKLWIPIKYKWVLNSCTVDTVPFSVG